MVSFTWKCPSCGHAHNDDIDPICGPFVTVICSSCNKCFDDTLLTPEEVKDWDAAIETALAMD